MNWYTKTAKIMSDLEKWVQHGVHPDDCRKELKPIHDKREATKKIANKKAEELGHMLFREWTYDTNRCRKCGMTVKMPNILGQTDVPDIIGRAVTEPCNCHLDNVSKNYFNLSDERLKGLNKTPDITII